MSTGGRGVEGWNAFAVVGTRQARCNVQTSVAASDRNSWSLSSDCQPTATSLQPSGERIGSDTEEF